MEGNTSVLSMASVGHLELVNLDFQTPSQDYLGEKNAISISHRETQHTHAHTPPFFFFLILCDLLLVLGWPMEDIFGT